MKGKTINIDLNIKENMDLLKALQWRYATKRMSGAKVSQKDLDYILEATRLSASSLGLQPYKILVTNKKEILEALYPIANNQMQLLECSHVLIFAAWDKITDQRIDSWIEMIREQRGSVLERLLVFAEKLKEKSRNIPEEENFVWISKQTYIAMTNAMLAAAYLGIDTTPMEGFDPAKCDEYLGLREQGLRSTLLLPIGYRNPDTDFLLKEKKVRWPAKDIIEFI